MISENPAESGSFVDVGGSRVFYRKAGGSGGETIILLHGFPTSSYDYRKLLSPLSKYGQVIAPDLFGFGYSDPSSENVPTAAKLLKFIGGFAEAVGLKRFVLAGHDWGGGGALIYAIQNPSAVSKLILMNMTVYPDWIDHFRRSPDYAQVRRMARSGFYRMMASSFLNAKQVKQLISPDVPISKEDLDQFVLFCKKAIRNMVTLYSDSSLKVVKETMEQILPRLPGLNIPTLIIWAKNDPYIPVAHADRLSGDIKASKLVFLENTGHFLLEEKPQQVGDIISDFLAG